jgi:hypothetical protein
MIEDHAEELTRGVLRDLAVNPKTPAYHQLSHDELHKRVYDVYHNLGRWLGERSDGAVEASYSGLGRLRHSEGVPISEVVQALILIKDHLRGYIRTAGLSDSAVELYQEEELHLMISHFFDKAVYYTVRGYEAAAKQR